MLTALRMRCGLSPPSRLFLRFSAKNIWYIEQVLFAQRLLTFCSPETEPRLKFLHK
eukprot:m.18305 g.18305  ORF g.18305 m.18305 type:complete len:56 (+) comp3660_c0_seq2:877-1044(+)